RVAARAACFPIPDANSCSHWRQGPLPRQPELRLSISASGPPWTHGLRHTYEIAQLKIANLTELQRHMVKIRCSGVIFCEFTHARAGYACPVVRNRCPVLHVDLDIPDGGVLCLNGFLSCSSLRPRSACSAFRVSPVRPRQARGS